MTSIKQVILNPNSTISNTVTDMNAGMTAHQILSDENLRTRLRTTQAIVGNKLTRVGLETYTLAENERVKALRIAAKYGQVGITAGMVTYLNNITTLVHTDFKTKAFPTNLAATSIGKVASPWWYKNPADAGEWEQADLDGLELWINWRDSATPPTWDARLYEIEVRAWILERPETTGLSPHFNKVTENNNPGFKWAFVQDGNSPEDAPQIEYTLAVWSKAVVEDDDPVFDPETSASVWKKTVKSSSQDVPYPTDKPELAFGTEYYWGVKAANKFNGVKWYSLWSQPVLFKTNTPPVVDVTDPAGALTDTNTPVVEWTYTDAEAHPQSAYEIRIYKEPNPQTNKLTLHQSTTDPNVASLGQPHWEPGGGMTLLRETTLASHGTQSLKLKKSAAAGDMFATSESGEYPQFEPPRVIPGEQYTAMAKFRGLTTARQCNVWLWWLDENEVWLGGGNVVIGATALDTVGVWTLRSATGVAPAGAHYAKISVYVTAAGANEEHLVDEAGFSNGTNTVFLPGVGNFPGVWAEVNPDEDTYPPVWETAVTGSEDLAHLVDVKLANLTNFRTYMRVAHSIVDSPPYLWSAWDFLAFNTNLTLPPTPTLTAVGAGDRVNLTLQGNAGTPAPERFEIERSLDGGATWELFRLGTDGLSVFYTGTVFAEVTDYEPPFFKPVRYRAFSIDMGLQDLYSAPTAEIEVTVGENKVWVKDPSDHTKNRSFRVTDGWLNYIRQRQRSLHRPVGRRTPVVVRGDTKAVAFNLELVVLGEQEIEDLEAILDLEKTLFIQTPRGSWYVEVIGDMSSRDGLFDRRANQPEASIVSIPFQEVEYVPSQ